jgi:pectin methylesterase-like acyl-CoA thioesterase
MQVGILAAPRGVSFTLRLMIGMSLGLGLAISAQASNYYVDPNYSGANGAPYDGYAAAYNTIAAALGAVAGVNGVPGGASPSNPNYLYFAPGTYNTTAGMATPASLSYSKTNVDFVGLTGNPNDVVITSDLDGAYNNGGGAYGTTGSSSLQLKGNNESAAFVTFANGTDTPYIQNTTHLSEAPNGTFPTLNGAGAANTPTSNYASPALLLQGDEQVFNDCNMVGYQDTLYTKGGRAYFNNCYVTGDVDFIFANGTDVFNNSTINMDSDHPGGTITAASTAKTTSNGIVFLNSKVTGNSTAGNAITDPNNGGNHSATAAGSMYLGRPWGWTQAGGDASTVFVNTAFASNGGVSDIESTGWEAWDSTETNPTTANNGGNPQEDSRYAEYNSYDLTSGNPLNTSSRVSWSHQLTASQAANYTVDNIFGETTFNWYGDGYTSTDSDTISNSGLSAAGTGSTNPSDSNFSWPAFWGDRNINNETSSETTSPINLENDPGSYADSNWTVGGNWDPSMAVALVSIPEPATTAIFAGLLIVPLLRRPRQRLAR